MNVATLHVFKGMVLHSPSGYTPGMWLPPPSTEGVIFKTALVSPCSRLSINPAQDASDWRCPRGVYREDDGLPCFLDDEAEITLENPDIRVPAGTKREDGLQGEVVEEDAEEPGREENGESTEDREEKEDADRRHGNSEVPRGAAEQGRKEENGDTLTARHAPGGTWLTKVRSFLKDSLNINWEGNSRRGEGRDSAGGGRRTAWREQGGDEEE
ncbi:hypothetical protein NDU88_003994 [Pleurodeles waltl]|uniref:Uncharacterized protein n=1 Tax=Pleurodeles waltl TaxID=8319 RepID=A0AAV7L0L6_PLEWA|nr:hypothetical protein NDU88_003994 [Pleurodeles waltl]